MQMNFDRALSDMGDVGNLFVAETLANKQGDLALSRGQLIRKDAAGLEPSPLPPKSSFDKSCREPYAACSNFSDTREQLRRLVFLENNPKRTIDHSRTYVAVLHGGAQYNNTRCQLIAISQR